MEILHGNIDKPDIISSKKITYPGLNTVKAMLILLVVVAHCLPQGMILYFNYFFKMPLFLSVGGFLLTQEVFAKGTRKYIKYLLERLFLPWVLFFVVYLPFQLQGRGIDQIALKDFLYPYYHLWYIPAYALGGLTCCLITKLKINIKIVLVATALFTAIWYIIYRDNNTDVASQPLFILGDKRFYAYLFYFITGFSIRNGLVKVKPPKWLLIATMFLALITIVFCLKTHQPDTIGVIPYFLFNLSLVFFVLTYIAPLKIIQNQFMVFVNKYSLGIYFLHPLIIMLLFKILQEFGKNDPDNVVGFIVGLITISVVLPITWMLSKWSVTSKLLLGSIKKGVG